MAKPSLFDQALAAEGVTGSLADVARSIYQQESGGGRNTKTSNAGAVGGMQIIPSTFASVADKGWDITNPEHNMRAGIRYLQQLNRQAKDDPYLLAAGYYGGLGGMEKARKGIAVSDPRNPHAPTTLQYAQQVVDRLPAPARQESPVLVANAAYRSNYPVPVVESDTPPPVGSVIREEDVVTPWVEFRQALPQQIQPSDLAFQAQPVMVPPAQSVQVAPDFRVFKPLRGWA